MDLDERLQIATTHIQDPQVRREAEHQAGTRGFKRDLKDQQKRISEMDAEIAKRQKVADRALAEERKIHAEADAMHHRHQEALARIEAEKQEMRNRTGDVRSVAQQAVGLVAEVKRERHQVYVEIARRLRFPPGLYGWATSPDFGEPYQAPPPTPQQVIDGLDTEQAGRLLELLNA